MPGCAALLTVIIPAYAASNNRSLDWLGRVLISSRYRREKLKRGNWAATSSASTGRSTSRSGGSSLTLKPKSKSRASWAEPVRLVDMGTPSKSAGG